MRDLDHLGVVINKNLKRTHDSETFPLSLIRCLPDIIFGFLPMFVGRKDCLRLKYC